ncbi:hypothetical protein Tco_1459038 [Tanacetum coccineum]
MQTVCIEMMKILIQRDADFNMALHDVSVASPTFGKECIASIELDNMLLYDILNEFQKGHSHIATVYKDLNKKIDTMKESKDTETPKYNSHDVDIDSVKNDEDQQAKRSPPSTLAIKKRHRDFSAARIEEHIRLKRHSSTKLRSKEEAIDKSTKLDILNKLEDDPNDADFEPDFGTMGIASGNEVKVNTLS